MKHHSPILIYDANCRFCVSSKGWIERWDINHHIQFLPFQTEEAKKKVPSLAELGCLDAMRLIDANGRVSSGVSAFYEMLPFLPMGKLLALFFRLPGISFFANGLYRVIAKNRYCWFGTVREK
ncbi:MAG: DUF393 domain-containing protein [Nitrospirota bacterium]